jgi:capsular exopolysaccharide synthesis family protein
MKDETQNSKAFLRKPDTGLGRTIITPVTRAYSTSPGISYNWEQTVRILRKNLRLLILIAALIISGVSIYVFTLKNIYAPVARVQVDPPGSASLSPREPEMLGEDTQEYLETQSQILQSDELATSVIRSLRLDLNDKIVGARSLAKYGAAQTSRPAESPLKNVENSIEQQFRDAERTPLETIALRNFRKSLSVGLVRGSRLIEVSFASENPRLAQQITNTLVAQFIDHNFKTRYLTTMQASGWLMGQLADLRDKVEESNQSVVAYQKRYNLVEEDEKDGPSSQLASGISHQLAESQADRIQSEAYLLMLESGQADSLPQLRQSTVYQNITTQFAEASARLAQAKAIYGEENNNYKKLLNEVNELAAQREAERLRVSNEVKTAYAAAAEREHLMLASMAKLKAQMGDVNERMVRYHVLKDESKANADLYNTLLARLKEAGLYAGLKSSNIRVVDPASVLDKPTSPHRALMISVGVLLAGFFAICVAFVRESITNTIRTPEDIEEWTGLPSIAMVPKLLPESIAVTPKPPLQGTGLLTDASKQKGIPGHLPKVFAMRNFTMEAEAFCELRTSILFANNEEPPRAILVTSSAAEEGKSTVAIHLAMALAQLGKTCLIDGDLRRPVICRALGVAPIHTWPEVLSGGVNLQNTLVPVKNFGSLWVLPLGPSSGDPGGLISSDQMKRLLATLRTEFDFLVIDSPPAIPFSDARVLSLLADGVVLVGRYGLTTRRALARCAECLRAVGAPILGVVINGIDFSSPDYRYYNFGYGSARLHGYYPGPQEVKVPSKKDAPKSWSASAGGS